MGLYSALQSLDFSGVYWEACELLSTGPAIIKKSYVE